MQTFLFFVRNLKKESAFCGGNFLRGCEDILPFRGSDN